jgi:hypothetical protein
MPALKPAMFWTASCELQAQNLAFSLQTVDEGRGATKKRIFSADWLRDGQVMFNPSQRVGGWLRKQLPLLRLSYKEQVDALKAFPADGANLWEPIAEAKELVGSDKAPEDNMEYPKGLSFPNKQHITVSDAKGGKRSTTAYWLVLPKPISIKVRIMSFARSITPEMVEEALRELGKATGIGDKYSQGYGRFELKGFKAEQKRLKL